MALATYYFDASDAGPTDTDNKWSNEPDAFDGSIATSANQNIDTGSSILSGEGTTAPSSGTSISQVRARAYIYDGGGGMSGSMTAVNWREDTALTGTLLGTIDPPTATAWTNYVTLTAPSGGWTWAKVQSLSVEFDGSSGFMDAPDAFASEIEVTSADVLSLDATAFRFYEDGTESGSTALATQDTDILHNLRDGNLNLALRIRLQNSGIDGLTTDDFQLQYAKNGGSYTNVTSSSSDIQGFDSGDLTDGGTTTNRLGSGTGSFVAGEIAEDGLVDNRQVTESNYTEMLYSLTSIAEDLVHQDYLDFKVLLNGSAITNTEIPRITASKEPLYKSAPISGTVSSAGYTKIVRMILDE